ncbi:MAG: hypothetical protein ACXWW6_06435, partial [Candidatus Limnocylindrales bacterium]
DVDLEEEPEQDAQDEACQGKEHVASPSGRIVSARLPDPTDRQQPAPSAADHREVVIGWP